VTEIALASYNGAATLSSIAVPPTGNHLTWYFEPLQSWLKDFSINVGGEEFHPYDDTIPFQLAERAKINSVTMFQLMRIRSNNPWDMDGGSMLLT